MEDDDFLNPDDYVGYINIDYMPCKTKVFDKGLISGWTSIHHLEGYDDVSYLKYKIYCEKYDLP